MNNMRDKVIDTLNIIGKSRKWLADEANIAKQNLSSWLNGKDTLSDEAIGRIQKVLMKYDASFGFKKYHLEWNGQRYDFECIDDIADWIKHLEIGDQFINVAVPIFNENNEEVFISEIIIAPVDRSVMFGFKFQEIVR